MKGTLKNHSLALCLCPQKTASKLLLVQDRLQQQIKKKYAVQKNSLKIWMMIFKSGSNAVSPCVRVLRKRPPNYWSKRPPKNLPEQHQSLVKLDFLFSFFGGRL